MTRFILAAGIVAMAGCSTPLPTVDPAVGSIACVHVSTLTTSTTTVYVAADRPGSVVVQPDCTVAATVE